MTIASARLDLLQELLKAVKPDYSSSDWREEPHNCDAASLLLEKDASTNEGAEESPLMYAISKHNISLAKLLLKRGEDPYSVFYRIGEAPPLVLVAAPRSSQRLRGDAEA